MGGVRWYNGVVNQAAKGDVMERCRSVCEFLRTSISRKFSGGP